MSPNSREFKDLQAILDSIPSHPESASESKMSDNHVTEDTRLSSNPKTFGQVWPDIRTLPDYIPKRAPGILLIAYLNSYSPGTFVHLIRCTTAAQDEVKDRYTSILTNSRNRVTTCYWSNDCHGREKPDINGQYPGGARMNRKKGDSRYKCVDLGCALDNDYRNAVAQTQEQVESCNLRHWLNVSGSSVPNAEDDIESSHYDSDDSSLSKDGNHQKELELASDQLVSAFHIEGSNTRPIASIGRTPLDFDDRQFYVTHGTQGLTRLAREIVAREISVARAGPLGDMRLEQAVDETLEILLSIPFSILRSLIRGSLPADKVCNLIFMLWGSVTDHCLVVRCRGRVPYQKLPDQRFSACNIPAIDEHSPRNKPFSTTVPKGCRHASFI